ncbi:unnamed protein product, partial [Owenia fusiformis]
RLNQYDNTAIRVRIFPYIQVAREPIGLSVRNLKCTPSVVYALFVHPQLCTPSAKCAFRYVHNQVCMPSAICALSYVHPQLCILSGKSALSYACPLSSGMSALSYVSPQVCSL